MNSRGLVVAVLSVPLLVLAACSGETSASGGSGPSSTTANIATTIAGSAQDRPCEGETLRLASTAPTMIHLPFFLARQAGLFEQTGLTTESVDLGSTGGIVTAVASDSVDVGIAGFASLVGARAAGTPIRGFAEVSNQFGYNLVLKKAVAEAAGITPTSSAEEKIAALKGLRLSGSAPGSSGDQVLRYLFKYAGMDADQDAQIISASSAADLIAAFDADRIDGFVLSSPGAELGAQKGDGVVVFAFEDGSFEPFAGALNQVAFTSENTLRDHPVVLECFTDGIALALKMLQDQPEEAKKLARQAFKDTPDDVFEQAWRANVSAYPRTPAIDRQAARKSADVTTFVTGEEFTDDQLDEFLNVDIAGTTLDSGSALSTSAAG